MFVKLLAKFTVGVLFLLLLLVSCSPKNSFQTVKKSSLKDRAVILNKVIHKKMTQMEAAIHLKVSDRQIRNLIKIYKLY